MKTRSRAAQDEALIDETAWMLTLSDLLMLLLTLFAMRLSMGQLRPESLPAADRAESGNGTGEGLPALRLNALTAAGRIGELSAQLDGRAKEGTAAILERESGGDGSFALSGVVAAQRGLTTEIHLRGAFSAATPELSFQGAEQLKRIAKAIADEQVEIGIGVKISADTYQDISSEEIASLTTARIRAVMRQMIDAGVEPQALYGNFAELRKPSVTYSEDGASEMVELLVRRSYAPQRLKR